MIKSITALPTPNLKILPPSVAQVMAHPTWDVILILVLLAIAFFYGISRGRHRMLASMLNTYVAFTLFSAIPLDRISQLTGIKDLFYLKTGVFTALFITLTLLFTRGRPRAFARANPWWQVFLLSFLQVGLILHIIFSFLPPARILTLAPVTRMVFANLDLHLWWLGIPIVILILLRRLGMRDE